MGVIEQLRTDLIERISTADEQALQEVALVLNAQAEDDDFVVPQWQQEEMRKRVTAREADPSLLIPRETAEAMIRKMAGK